MNKTLITLSVVLLVIISSYGYAIQVTDIQSGLETNNAEIQSLKASINANISSLENKLSDFATKQEMQDLMTGYLIKNAEIMESFRYQITITIAMIMISAVALIGSFYLYLKSKGRLDG